MLLLSTKSKRPCRVGLEGYLPRDGSTSSSFRPREVSRKTLMVLLPALVTKTSLRLSKERTDPCVSTIGHKGELHGCR